MLSLTPILIIVVLVLIYLASEKITESLPPLVWPDIKTIPSAITPTAPTTATTSAPGGASPPAQSSPPANKNATESTTTRGVSSVDVNTDISSFDFAGAAARSRGTSDSAPGGAASAAAVTGGNIVAPIVDQTPVVVSSVIPPAPTLTPAATIPTASAAAVGGGVASTATLPVPGAERPDYRCGPSAGNAKCGVGRCCSVFGWCGSAGEDHCKPGINAAAYNGPNAPLACSIPSALNCSGAPALDSAKYYYEAAGPGKGVYVMRPLSGAAGPGPNTCNVGYQYLDAGGQVVGSDTRTFTYMQDGCIWRAYQAASSGTGSAIVK